tara:strand:+ start:1682 stop:1819 length:138 start_codon:yes stop_codon:yes gene_type:complete
VGCNCKNKKPSVAQKEEQSEKVKEAMKAFLKFKSIRKELKKSGNS